MFKKETKTLSKTVLKSIYKLYNIKTLLLIEQATTKKSRSISRDFQKILSNSKIF